MNFDQLIGRHLRLKQEPSVAYSTLPCNTGRINRLGVDLAFTARAIQSIRISWDERSGTRPRELTAAR